MSAARHAGAAAGAAAAGSSSSAAASSCQLLGYEQQIVQEMVEQDALCVMGAGLGWQRVVAAMLQMHDSTTNGKQLGMACTALHGSMCDGLFTF
jgi:hypothetical protein